MKRRLLAFLAFLSLTMGAALFQSFHGEPLRARQRAEERAAAALRAAIAERERSAKTPSHDRAVASEEAPLDLGPPSAAASAEADAAVFDLLSGRVTAARLPVVATSDGIAFDDGLRDRLSPLEKPAPSAGCECPPGDPPCDCF